MQENSFHKIVIFVQQQNDMNSKNIFYIGFLFILLTSFFYYPKWNKTGTEATIGWDVSGYYWYLPSIFIYKDIKEQKFASAILEKYHPTPDLQQFFKNRNGAYVMKYSIGQAVQFFPFFVVAHLMAKPLGFEADGFSKPYHFALQFGSLLMCLVGLWFLRKSMLEYFSDHVTALVMAIIIFATNYFNYAAIDNALTHNWLFTWYTLLIYCTIQFYKKPSTKYSLLIGGIVGICALTRPTDIIALIIPVCWGLQSISISAISDRMKYFWSIKSNLILAAAVTCCIGMIQLCYFMYAGGEWFVYSYQDQTFSWLHPHFFDYMFSFRTGWILYTPIFILAIPGAYFIYQKKLNWVALFLFALINTYIVMAWDIWWYGGRAMVQSYPILSFFLASVIERLVVTSFAKYALYGFIGMCTYYNMWWTHGVHRGAYFDAYDMTRAYYFKQVGKWNMEPQRLKLYDTDELFEGQRKNIKAVYENNFDNDSMALASGKRINNSASIYVNGSKQFSSTYELPIKNGEGNWLRVSNTFLCTQKEWNFWLMPQVVVKFSNHDKVVKQNMYRPHRFLVDGQIADLYIDVKIPDQPFNKVQLLFWNADGQKETLMDNVRVEIFDE